MEFEGKIERNRKGGGTGMFRVQFEVFPRLLQVFGHCGSQEPMKSQKRIAKEKCKCRVK